MAEKQTSKDEAPKASLKDTNPLAVPAENLQAERGEVKVEDQIAPLVASPTGPVPLSAFVNDPEQAERIREERREALQREREGPRAGDYLEEETVRGLDQATLRTVARQRGYKMRGRRISAEDFLAQQNEDEGLRMKETPKKGKK